MKKIFHNLLFSSTCIFAGLSVSKLLFDKKDYELYLTIFIISITFLSATLKSNTDE